MNEGDVSVGAPAIKILTAWLAGAGLLCVQCRDAGGELPV